MKKTLTLLTAICLMFSLAACDKSNEKGEVGSDGNAGNVNAGELSSDALANLKPIDIFTESTDEVKDIIDKQSNFKVADNFEINAPEKAELIECTAKSSTTQDFKKYYEEYKEMFNYIFPNNTIDENYLFYLGGSSDINYDDNGNKIQDYNKVKDKYDDLVAGNEGPVALLYDETWLGDVTDWNSQICFEIGSEIGAGYAMINKGKTVGLKGKVKNEFEEVTRYPLLESYDPADYLECIGTYSPDSTESFKLLDKEMPINEAVDFFENYVNNIPYPKNANIETCVISVDVLKVDEKTYGYNFLTTGRYKGIAFDRLGNGTFLYAHDIADYMPTSGSAFMLESNDIDIISKYYRADTFSNIKSYNDSVDVKTAVKTASENLSAEVQFEVQNIDFVYRRKFLKNSEGYIDIENGYPNEIFPVWKFTMINPNDGLNYIAYVDAKDGENFKYYTRRN